MAAPRLAPSTVEGHAFRRPAITALDMYVGAVIGVGFAAIAAAAYAIVATPPPLNTLVFAALGLLAGMCAVKIPGVNARVSAADTFFIALCRDHGYPELTLYRGKDQYRAQDIAATLREVTGLPLE